jgi:hypothetical protein
MKENKNRNNWEFESVIGYLDAEIDAFKEDYHR